MGGRGRGASRGNSKAILDSLGLQKGDVVADRVQSPAETFPPLQFPPPKPSDKESTLEKYPLMVKKELREHLINSKYKINYEKTVKEIEHYSDKYLALLNVPKPLTMDWSRLPKELHPPKATVTKKIVAKRKSTTVKPNIKKRKIKEENITEKLDELEKKEEKDGVDSEKEDDPDKTGEEGRGTGEDEELEELEEDEQDEEMDEGTDYYQSYFDNGEADDDDDGLDEGGVM